MQTSRVCAVCTRPVCLSLSHSFHLEDERNSLFVPFCRHTRTRSCCHSILFASQPNGGNRADYHVLVNENAFSFERGKKFVGIRFVFANFIDQSSAEFQWLEYVVKHLGFNEKKREEKRKFTIWSVNKKSHLNEVNLCKYRKSRSAEYKDQHRWRLEHFTCLETSEEAVRSAWMDSVPFHFHRNCLQEFRSVVLERDSFATNVAMWHTNSIGHFLIHPCSIEYYFLDSSSDTDYWIHPVRTRRENCMYRG